MLDGNLTMMDKAVLKEVGAYQDIAGNALKGTISTAKLVCILRVTLMNVNEYCQD